MIVHNLEQEIDIVEEILEAKGYRFQLKGEATKSQLNALIQAVETRLEQEKAITKGPAIKEAYIIPIRKKQIQRKKAVGDVILLSDFYKEIDMTAVYLILDSDKIEDELAVDITIPLIMDCETFNDLFDISGRYIGSSRDIDESLII